MFYENIEDSDLPNEAKEMEFHSIYRLCKKSAYELSDFDSHEKLGKTKPNNCDRASFCSCSLTTNYTILLKASPLLKKQCKYAIELNLQKGSGKMLKKSHHVDFWRYNSFNILGAILKVVPI